MKAVDLEDAAVVCYTRTENTDPDWPNNDGTCLVVIRVPVSSLPTMITMTGVSYAEQTELKNCIEREVDKTYRHR